MLEIKTFEVGSFGTNMYLVSDGAGNILLIDPACSSLYEQQMLYRSVNEVVCQQRGLSAESGLTILATHGHLDHLWGAAWACEQWHTPVLMHEADIPMAKAMQAQYDLFGIGGTPVPFPIEPLPVNQSVSAAVCQCNGLSAQRSVSVTVCQRSGLTILSTPGHTPGSVCFYVPEDGVTVTSYPNGKPEPGKLYDESYLARKNKYAYFLGGNQPLCVVRSEKPGAEGKLLLVRDSYADSLTPFLTERFAEIHLIDLRYYKMSAAQYIEDNGIDMALVLYSVPNFVSDSNLVWIGR